LTKGERGQGWESEKWKGRGEKKKRESKVEDERIT